MKKERIVALCICAVLLGNLYLQGIAWVCHFTMPSISRTFWPVLFDREFGKAKNGWRPAALSDSVTAYICTSWPALGFVYGEAQLLKAEPESANARGKWAGQSHRRPE